MSDYRIQELGAAPNIKIRFHCEITEALGETQLERVALRDSATRERELLDCHGLFILIGGRPRTDWLPVAVRRDEWGSILTGRDAGANPVATNASSIPGLYAVGDARRGAARRVAGAVGDGALAITQVHEHLDATRAAKAPIRRALKRRAI
jgi:thioredoxin reductase (NADPH)